MTHDLGRWIEHAVVATDWEPTDVGSHAGEDFAPNGISAWSSYWLSPSQNVIRQVWGNSRGEKGIRYWNAVRS